MIIRAPEAYWGNLESLVSGFLITPLCKMRHPSMVSTNKKQAISCLTLQATAKLAQKAIKRSRQRSNRRNSKELTVMLSKYVLEFSIHVPNTPSAWQQGVAQMLGQAKERQKQLKW